MELEGSFKKHKRKGERVRVVQKGVFGGGVGGVGGGGVRVLSTLGHETAEMMGHLLLSDLHAMRRSWWCSSCRNKVRWSLRGGTGSP